MSIKSTPKIYFFYEQEVALRRRTELKEFLLAIFKRYRKNLQGLNYVFCSDQRVLEINREFLKHDYFTDIITFELTPPGVPIEAEIYISVDRVRENALGHGESFSRELHRVIFHGALHLCGFKDKLQKDQKRMRELEQEWLERYFGE